MEFKDIVQKRYATKKFDGKQLPEDKVEELLDLIRLSASSYGLQPWKIKVVRDQATKDKLLEHSWNQPQITTCSHLLVFCANSDIKSHIDKYEEMMKSSGAPAEAVSTYIGIMRQFLDSMDEKARKTWSQKQTYLAVGNALNGAKDLGFDSCPMEGFLPDKYSEILSLPSNIVPTVLVPIGYAADQPRPKIRYSKDELFF